MHKEKNLIIELNKLAETIEKTEERVYEKISKEIITMYFSIGTKVKELLLNKRHLKLIFLFIFVFIFKLIFISSLS